MNKLFLLSLLLFLSLNSSFSRDISTFSNYEIIQQTKVELNFNIDFNNKVVEGIEKIYFTALKDGEVIILDTRALIIKSIIDCDTGEELEYIIDSQYELEGLGVPLKIFKDFNEGEQLTLLLKFNTTKEGVSIDWLEPEQTSGKKYPYMYSQGETILNRELFPSQDTPSVKAPYSVSLTVEKPLFALDSGIYQSKIDNGDTVTYFYKQEIPIPSYLVAIAAGAIEERVVSDRTKIYGEKEVVDLAAYEFEDTENFIQIAESYISPYLWGQYNILILPPSCPFGGMENPTLTFITSSLIAGDKSLSSVVAHEICHSWSGNLVTMNSWPDFWLNEGFTMFLERKIIEYAFDLDTAKLDAMVSYSDLSADIISYGESKSFTQLIPDLIGRNPDDAFNKIPYEKGFNLLYYLENLVNSESDIDLFRKILRGYFDKFQYLSIRTDDFKEYFIETVKKELPSKAEEILAKIEWKKWLYAPGFPPIKNDFSNKYDQEIREDVALFYENKLPDDFIDTFKGWHSLLKQYFLSQIKDTNKELDDIQLSYLSNTLNLKEGYNVEVNCLYFLIVLFHGKTIEEDVKNALITFLGKHGRINYVRPLYTAFFKRDKETAMETFLKYKSFYHPTIVKLIELLLKTL
jgi:leukotriene-A4 hydrolase